MQSAAPAGDWAPIHHVITGPAVDVICDIAAREEADVIVVGARGMSGAERRMFGSTTEGILRNADRSVLVVPPRPPGDFSHGLGSRYAFPSIGRRHREARPLLLDGLE